MKSNFSYYVFVGFLFFSTLVEAQWVKQFNGLPQDWGIGWAIDASDSNNVLFSTNAGLFRTTDGGENWLTVQLPDSINSIIIDVFITDASHFWLASDNGKILATSDAGTNWSVQFFNDTLTQFMNYIEMFDSQNGIAMGDAPFPNQNKPALFLMTTDGGINWTVSQNSTFSNVSSGDTWRRLDFVDPTHGYFFESGINPQKLYKTSDGCANWIETNYSKSATVIKSFDENIILVQSIICNPVCVSTISKTMDGGDTWRETQLGDGWGNDFEFIPGDASKVFFTDSYALYFSVDTGSTWTEIFVDTIDWAGRDIQFADENHGWLLGDNGNLYKTSIGGVITDADNNTSTLPTEFSLSQNYPNPFNPVTTIRYSIPNVTLSGVEGSRVSLKIYDILGSEVATLVNEEQPAGIYNVQFTMNNLQLSSGIYFYQLKAGNFVETMKMILLK